ncbi:hypothetical protein CLOBOL_02474 [Enterocloster bolteae ATCC BAA-613]|uniref:Uncharacterized protein n=1 Tax=Enterocloster bolteae (strain ATCC BAA-613 / DSM 15670 / CCUG 46953 / JCM 12243 / WAL 16351) TaxID=411902 RepID=A8RPH8_ENTBW|nr:hypothetical protein CLOBOL_02474 [Enterocloster bolteae ATCC BAA-613]
MTGYRVRSTQRAVKEKYKKEAAQLPLLFISYLSYSF